MKLITLRSLTVVVVLLAVLVATPVFGGNTNSERGRPDATLEQGSDNLDPELRKAFQASGGQTTFLVELQEKADLSPAYSIFDWEERGEFVLETLQEVAERSQSDIHDLLKKEGVPFTPFYIVNVVSVTGDAALAQIWQTGQRCPASAQK